MKIFRNLWLILGTVLVVAQPVIAQNDVPTVFSNQGGVTNTRHNMTQRAAGVDPSVAVMMNNSRNGYGEVCVYCHTPHGANTSAAAPLWNRSLPTGTTYQTYDKLNTSTLTQTVSQPGAASLPCLSCHDGSQAIDAIINMPGSGGYSATPNPVNWVATGGTTSKAVSHRTLSAAGGPTSCLSCHNPTGGTGQATEPTDFTIFAIGTDLRNDHPVGVTFPTTNGPGTDWKAPGGTKVVNGLTNRFFDENSNSRMDKGDIRLYDSGNGASVECASCHDPHGVPSAGGINNPTFLRKTNTGSAVCMTCHNK